MADLTSDRPGIIDDTSDGDLGANAGVPQHGSLAEHELLDETRERAHRQGTDGGAGGPTG